MFEFNFYKGHGWIKDAKFSIKNRNNGWHRFIEITIPIKYTTYGLYNVVQYQITYWNNYEALFNPKKDKHEDIEPSSDNNTTNID